MKQIRVEVEASLLERARNLTGHRTDREVVETALRRLIASKQQDRMADGIATLEDLPRELGAPVRGQGH